MNQLILLTVCIIFILAIKVRSSTKAINIKNYSIDNTDKEEKSPITIHILDTTLGQPANNIEVHLSYRLHDNDTFELISKKVTDIGGRADLLPLAEFVSNNKNANCCFTNEKLKVGTYRIDYFTVPYLKQHNLSSFFTQQTLYFNIDTSINNQYFHIPILLNPAGFTAYRGS